MYSASKHAVQSFVHGLRRQLLAKGIRVGAVAPGMVLNELWGFHDEDEINRRAELGEGLRSTDVADAVLFMLTRLSNVTMPLSAPRPVLLYPVRSLRRGRIR